MSVVRIHFVDSIWEGAHIVGDSYYQKEIPPGSAKWATDQTGKIAALILTCPCGCGEICAVSIAPPADKGWSWDGNKELPTLTPSILRTEHCRWHGYLTRGEFISC